MVYIIKAKDEREKQYSVCSEPLHIEDSDSYELVSEIPGNILLPGSYTVDDLKGSLSGNIQELKLRTKQLEDVVELISQEKK